MIPCPQLVLHEAPARGMSERPAEPAPNDVESDPILRLSHPAALDALAARMAGPDGVARADRRHRL